MKTKIFVWATMMLAIVAVALGAYLYMTREAAPVEQGIEIANPAAVNCIEKGGRIEIVDTPEGQSGLCHLESGEVCEEWALFRGECATTTGHGE